MWAFYYACSGNPHLGTFHITVGAVDNAYTPISSIEINVIDVTAAVISHLLTPELIYEMLQLVVWFIHTTVLTGNLNVIEANVNPIMLTVIIRSISAIACTVGR